MAALAFSFLQILPVFFLIALGYVLRKRRLVSDPFLKELSGIVFYILLPPLLFLSIAETDLKSSFEPAVIFPTLGAVLFFSVLLYVIPGKNLSASQRGVFVQGAARSNLVFIGLAVLLKLYGGDILGKAGVFIAFHGLLMNFLSVLFLILPHHSLAHGSSWKKIGGQIIINPIILGCASGMAFAATGLKLPGVIRGCLEILSDATLPLALIIVGASLRGASLGKNFRLISWAVFLKLVLLPGIILSLLWLIGVPLQDILMSVVFLGSPTAAVSQIMAKEMEGDEDLASNIVTGATLFSPFTLAAWISILS